MWCARLVEHKHESLLTQDANKGGSKNILFLSIFFQGDSIKIMNQFLRLTKTKIKIVFYFFIISFLFGVLSVILNKALIESTVGEEELIFLIQYILPVPSLALTILKFYLFACLAIYFINKAEKNKLNYQNAKN